MTVLLPIIGTRVVSNRRTASAAACNVLAVPVYEVREELSAIIAAVALLACVCRYDTLCLPCRARILQTEITARGIRIRRWRNDSSNVPRLISHVAGLVDVQREPRRSAPRYIVHREQVCTLCGEPLAVGKWAPFFHPGETITKLRGRDGAQDFAQPIRPQLESISCAQLARIQTPRRVSPRKATNCVMLYGMDQARQGGEQSERPAGVYLPYGWHRVRKDGPMRLVPEAHAIRSTMFLLRGRGLSWRQIAKTLNSCGYTTNRGHNWSATAVMRIVDTPLPAGFSERIEGEPVILEIVVPAESQRKVTKGSG